MTVTGWLTIGLFAVILTVVAMPLGRYMAAVYSGERTFLDPLFNTPEGQMVIMLSTQAARNAAGLS